jgi:D-alanyl-D-alanine dipeptidase
MRKKNKIIISIVVASLLGSVIIIKTNNIEYPKFKAEGYENIVIVPFRDIGEDFNKTILKEKLSEPVKEYNGFVLLKSLDSSLTFDIRYATNNNFTKTKVYPTDICILRTNTANKLKKANDELKKLGYRIKIYDAYRSVSVQRIFWNLVKDNRYVANPDKGGSIHNRGSAVDLTMVNTYGDEVEMPSEFDDFSEKAYRENINMSSKAKENLRILTEVMINSGFTTIGTEWWHFEDSEKEKYSIVDIDLNNFN